MAILDSCGVPIAGVFDLFLVTVAAKRPDIAWWCAGLAVLGSTIGNTILYWMAHKGGRRFMDRAAPEGRAAKFRIWFIRYGMVTVFVPALVPIPMPLKLFVISAGVLGTSRTEFIGVVLLARFLRYFGEAWLGVRLGQESWHLITLHWAQFLAGAVILALALYGFILWRDRRVPNNHPL